MKLLEQNCSLIISKANQWLDKNKDRSQAWLDYNFPAMFLHLCKGNSEFNFLKDIGHYNMLRNKNFRYKIVEEEACKKLILDKKKAFIEKIKKVFNRIENINELKKNYYQTLKGTKETIINEEQQHFKAEEIPTVNVTTSVTE